MTAAWKLATWCGALLVWGSGVAPVAGQEPPPADPASVADPASSLTPELHFALEAKAHYRNSERNRFPVNFPFTPEMLPPGQEKNFEETVNEGSHFEVSTLTFLVDAKWSEGLVAHAKVDAIDLYDRNPTSSGRKLDVDELWIRFGRESEPGIEPERASFLGAYLKVGKLPKFERQNDRHLESYGLVSTAFNRFEDAGAELGLDFGRHVYLKLSATQGNPVFLRDPNALAGDNGTPNLETPFPNPTIKTGVVIFYDSEVQDLNPSGDLEQGAGLGFRFGDAGGSRSLDLLLWGYKRELADTVEREGTFYGGDLDLLNGPGNAFPIVGLRGNDKQEVGANLWIYWGGFSFFGQYVDQEIASLPRTGLEGEVAWNFELPLVWAAGGRQLFPSVAPALRYSKLDNDFRSHPQSPSPSFAWDWEKIDAGVRLGIVPGIDLTVEYADNRFILGSGAERSNNELLATLRWHT